MARKLFRFGVGTEKFTRRNEIFLVPFFPKSGLSFSEKWFVILFLLFFSLSDGFEDERKIFTPCFGFYRSRLLDFRSFTLYSISIRNAIFAVDIPMYGHKSDPNMCVHHTGLTSLVERK